MRHVEGPSSPRRALAWAGPLAVFVWALGLLGTPVSFAQAEVDEAADGAVAAPADAEDVAAAEALEAPSLDERLAPTWTRVEQRVRWFVEMLPLFAVALLAFILFWFIARAVSRWELPFRPLSDNLLLQQVMRQVVRALIVIVGLLLALELLDATALLGAVLGAAGVLGLALGFAFKDIIENYLASMLLSLRSPFRVADQVQIGEHAGQVVRMTTRDTILMTAEGNHLRLPNALVFKSVILNFTRNPLRRFDCLVGIGTDESVRESERVGLEALAATPGVCADPPPRAVLERLGDWTVDLRFSAWVDQGAADWVRVASEGRRRIKAALDAAEIAMPNPTYRVELVPQDAAPPEERRERRLAVEQRPGDPLEVAPDDVLARQIAKDIAETDEVDLLPPG